MSKGCIHNTYQEYRDYAIAEGLDILSIEMWTRLKLVIYNDILIQNELSKLADEDMTNYHDYDYDYDDEEN